jgi:hypothetical protein
MNVEELADRVARLEELLGAMDCAAEILRRAGMSDDMLAVAGRTPDRIRGRIRPRHLRLVEGDAD